MALKQSPEHWPVPPPLSAMEDPAVERSWPGSCATQMDMNSADDLVKKFVAHYSNWARLLMVLACLLIMPRVQVKSANEKGIKKK